MRYLVLTLVLAVAALAGLLLWTQGRHDSFVRACAEAGGHIYQPDGSKWCLDDEGRFVEVYP